MTKQILNGRIYNYLDRRTMRFRRIARVIRIILYGKVNTKKKRRIKHQRNVIVLWVWKTILKARICQTKNLAESLVFKLKF